MRNFLFSALVRLFGLLPSSVSRQLARLLVWIAYRLNLREATNARANTRLCFPDLTPTQVEQFVRETLLQNALTIFEMPTVWVKSPEYWLRHLDDEDTTQKVKQLLARKKGLIIALPHLGNWELSSHYFPQFGAATGLYRPPRQKGLEAAIIKGRSAAGGTLVPTTASGIKLLIAALRRGEIVVILPDQQPKQQGAAAVFAPFFGVPALTMTLLSRLAARTQAPVLMTSFLRDGNSGRFKVESFEADEKVSSKDAEVATAALNHDIEKLVLLQPSQYQWVYRRFSNQPDQSPCRYEMFGNP